MNTPLKRCTKCGNEFPATPEFFYRHKRGKNGLTPTCKKCQLEWRRQHHQQVREIANRWYHNHKEQATKSARRYQDAHRTQTLEAGRRWTKNHPQSCRDKAKRRRSKKHSRIIAFNSADWDRCLDWWNNRCAYCGRPQGLWHILAQDHFVPLNKGGSYTVDNIVPACHAKKGGEQCCNNLKGTNDPHEWLIARFGPRKAKQIEKRIAKYFAWAKLQ